MRVPHSRWARALAVGTAVVALHLAALMLAWHPSGISIGFRGDARPPAVSATLVSPPERAAPTRQQRPASAPVARARQAMTPAAPASADMSQWVPLGPAPAFGIQGGDGSSPVTLADGSSDPTDDDPASPPAPLADESTVAAAGRLVATPVDADQRGENSWTPPPAGQMEYEVLGEAKGLSYQANAVLDWQRDDKRYRLELALRAFLLGSRIQVSSGTLTPAGLQPARFEDRARRERWLTFEWPAPPEPGRARTHGDISFEGLPIGTQDRLGVFIQLGGWMEAMEPGQRWRIPVVSPGLLESWTIEVVGRESIAVPAGSFEALHLRRVPDGAQDLRVEAWYAPAIAGLPVRIVLLQSNGDRVEQRLRRWHPASATP